MSDTKTPSQSSFAAEAALNQAVSPAQSTPPAQQTSPTSPTPPKQAPGTEQLPPKLSSSKHDDLQTPSSASQPPSEASQAHSEASQPPSEVPKKHENATPKKVAVNGKLVLIALPIVLVVLLFIAVQIKNMQGTALPTAPITNTNLVEPTTKVDRTPLQQRLDRLKTELQEAEPTRQEFSFPPVDGELSLESK
jgi:hypothetical protein